MNERILIVDDDEKIQNLISIYLKNEGYMTLEAGDALEALKILGKGDVDLIMLDIMMPDMNGIEACMKI